MADLKRSRLTRMTVRNIGCIGSEGLVVELDNIVCLVGKNNAGKSTVLRAYELAKGTLPFSPVLDRHQHATAGEASEILLEVHIPDGIGNVDDRWKEKQGELLIVKSRWQWLAPGFEKVRTTWDPKGGADQSGEWAADGKAGGADAVFGSRLPRPLRIGSLDDAAKTEEMLLTLALTPLLLQLEKERLDPESGLAKAISSVSSQIDTLSGSHQIHFNEVAGRISSGFQKVFPRLDVRLDIAAAPLVPKLSDLVRNGSGLRIKDGASDTQLGQQGTGARRALFWAMLQVHNELTRDRQIRDEYRKKLASQIAVYEKTKAGKKVTPEAVSDANETIAQLTALLEAHDGGAPIPEDQEDPALPGYLLLIDEPENALHPMAARAAQRHLYELAESPDWQVMLTTHSPYFVNPFEDHTTIVRLERGQAGGGPIAPRTYRSDSIAFEGDAKQRLQALQQIDPSLAEVFFGSYPVLVEGDTEHAAFIAAIVEKADELMGQVTVVRARGKAILVPLIKVLTHFKIDFGIVHDCDPPFKSNGDKNGMWTENEKIRVALLQARGVGLQARHRVSVPDFERFLGADAESKGKPLNAYLRIRADSILSARVQALLLELVDSTQLEPFQADTTAQGYDYLSVLRKEVTDWAESNGKAKDIRFAGGESAAA